MRSLLIRCAKWLAIGFVSLLAMIFLVFKASYDVEVDRIKNPPPREPSILDPILRPEGKPKEKRSSDPAEERAKSIGFETGYRMGEAMAKSKQEKPSFSELGEMADLAWRNYRDTPKGVFEANFRGGFTVGWQKGN